MRIGQRPAAGRGREHHVAVKRAVHGIDGARQARLRHDCNALGLRLGENGVGGHHHEGGTLACAAFGERFEGLGWKRRRQTAPAELAVPLERCRPEPGPAVDENAAGGVDNGNRADDVAVRRLRRGGTDPALAIDRGRAGAGADAAEGEIGTGRGGCRIAELAIGRKTAPVLVAAAQQIKQDGRGYDRYARGANRKAAALFLEPSLHPRRGIEAEGRAAGQRDGVDAVDRLRRIEQRAFACSRPAAAQIDRADGRLVEHDGGRAGSEAGVLGMADIHPGDVGDQVAQEVLASSGNGNDFAANVNRSHPRGGDAAALAWREGAGHECAMPNVTIAAALVAGMLSFLSPCVLPLVPPYLIYLTGTSLERLADEEAEPRVRRETIAAALLFVLGFSTVF